MQPTYIPLLVYFDLIDKVDYFVFFDDVQLTKRSWQVRNKIKSANGELWLSIPIKKTKSRDETLLNNAIPNYETGWIEKHLKSIEFNYKKAKYFSDIFDFLMKFYTKTNTLSEFNSRLIIEIVKKIGIETKLIYSSQLENIEGAKDVRLVNICKKINTDEYLSPQGSAVYINEKQQGGSFVDNNIKLFYHDYQHPVYNQLYGDFIPYIGIYDLLFNEGFENSLEIIRRGRKSNIYYTDLKIEQ